jgi:hypothetical protein
VASTTAIPDGFHFETGAPELARLAILFFAAFIAVYGATFFDARLLNGVSVWEKPAKFFLSLGVHMATLAWGISLLPQDQRSSKAIRRASFAFIGAALFELAYMMIQAARGEASHFNTSTSLASALYALMGIGSLTLTAVTGFVGWRIARAGTSVAHFAAGWGFIASAVATTLVAGVMSSGTSHWIGGDQTDATGLAFFHWSTTGGDLRPAHFAALHVMQAVPLVAWFWPDKRIAAASIAAALAVVAALFAQAWMGIPLFG